MTAYERFIQWNRFYDGLPPEWRFQFILWPVIALGAINVLLTVAMRFPFGLLLILGFIFIAVVRVPYLLGYYTKAGASRPRIRDTDPPWWIRPFV